MWRVMRRVSPIVIGDIVLNFFLSLRQRWHVRCPQCGLRCHRHTYREFLLPLGNFASFVPVEDAVNSSYLLPSLSRQFLSYNRKNILPFIFNPGPCLLLPEIHFYKWTIRRWHIQWNLQSDLSTYRNLPRRFYNFIKFKTNWLSNCRENPPA